MGDFEKLWQKVRERGPMDPQKIRRSMELCYDNGESGMYPEMLFLLDRVERLEEALRQVRDASEMVKSIAVRALGKS